MFTLERLADLGNIIRSALNWFAPGMIIIFSVLTAAALIRWSRRIAVSYKEVVKNPGGIFIWLFVLVIFFLAWFKVSSFFG